MNKLVFSALVIFSLNSNAQNTIPTTTVSGCLKVTDTLNVTNAIQSAGRITSSGEMIAKDTMRAEKDVIVEGNVKVAGKISVAGDAEFGGRVFLNEPSTATGVVNPCLVQMLVSMGPDREVLSLNPTIATQIENDLSATQCPQAPIIPFTWQTFGNHVNNNARWIGTIENFDFNIKTNSTQRITVKNNGQIFFGANKILSNHLHSNTKYQFDGKVGCKELVVVDPTKWADFVFEKNYPLLPLSEVETYYLLNKHLPSVPSEKEVKENGINTAEMDAILLQKIEELTLYIVEQQKQINTLKQLMKK